MQRTYVMLVLLLCSLLSHNRGFAQSLECEDSTNVVIDTKNMTAEEVYSLGAMFHDGSNGMPRNFLLAAKFYRLAAERKHGLACTGLAVLYERGDGVLLDYDKAFYWAEKAAELKEVYGTTLLGHYYAQGKSVQQNYKKAYELYLKAAELGSGSAMLLLGTFWENGVGVPYQDTEVAKYWYRKAVEKGEKSAVEALENLENLKE